MKTRWKVFIGVVIGILVLPYVLPRSTNRVNPQPFENSEWIEASGVTIHTRVFYDESTNFDKKILLIHGLGGSTFSFRNNTSELVAQGYYVVAVDLPAFGYSTRQDGLVHSQQNRATWLWEVIEQIDQRIKSDAQWILMGHSMGASVAIAMETQKSQKVSGLIFIDGAVIEQRSENMWLQFGYTQRVLQVVLHLGLIQEKRIQSFLASAYGRVPTDREVAGYLEPLQLKGTPVALTDFVSTATSSTIEDIVNQDLFIGLLWGEQDEWVPVEHVSLIQSRYPQAISYVFEGEGHCPNETAASFNDELISILSQMP